MYVFTFSRMQRGIEHSEFHRAFLEHGMKIQRVVPACVIMHIAPVPPVVPDAFETIQTLRLLLVYLPQKPLFDPSGSNLQNGSGPPAGLCR